MRDILSRMKVEQGDGGKRYLVTTTEIKTEINEQKLNMMLADAYANLAHHQAKADEYMKKIEQIKALMT